MDPEKMAREFVAKLADDLIVGVDLASGDDKSVAVAVQMEPDGTMRVIGHKEFYAEPSAPDYDIDLTAQDITDQRPLPKPTKE